MQRWMGTDAEVDSEGQMQKWMESKRQMQSLRRRTDAEVDEKQKTNVEAESEGQMQNWRAKDGCGSGGWRTDAEAKS